MKKERDLNAKIIFKKMKNTNNKLESCTIIKAVSSKEFNRYLKICRKLLFTKIYNKSH